MKQFARRHALRPGQLHYWVYQSSKPPETRAPLPTFQEVRLPASALPAGSWSTEIGLPNGTTVRLERDFRTLKTGRLEVRPVFLRKADRRRGHALVSLLALKLARELDRRVAPLGLTVEDAVDRLKGVRLVRLGEPGLGLWRLPERYPAAQTEVLEGLPKLPSPAVLSVGKPDIRRLRNQLKGRTNQ